MEATEATVDKNNFVGNLNLPSREKYLMHTTDQIEKKKKENISFFSCIRMKCVKGGMLADFIKYIHREDT